MTATRLRADALRRMPYTKERSAVGEVADTAPQSDLRYRADVVAVQTYLTVLERLIPPNQGSSAKKAGAPRLVIAE